MSNTAEEHFQLKGKDAEAIGEPVEHGFVVRKGAIARKEIVPSAIDSVTPLRSRLLSEGVLVEENGKFRFTRDHVFDSPSGAAAAILGRTANGWIEWKTAEGVTLNDVNRSPKIGALSPEKRRQIIEKHLQLLADGKLVTENQLNRYLTVFRDRFGPDVLRTLDGEPLLELIHDQSSKDSLVYWLEYKNDDEFDTRRFGGIAGGSALKFGVFRRKETGNWQAADRLNYPADISLDEAIELARKHRDQLLRGVKLLEALPSNASDEDYAHLQQQMDQEAPDVSDLAWGHKYFSLLYPDKLDDFHSPTWQRFHLLKLRQNPPEGKGRYVCAGRFVAAARDVGLPVTDFDTVLNAVNGGRHRYWRVGTRGGKHKVSHWPMMQERGCIAIGWHDLGDLAWVEANKASREKLKDAIHDKYPSSPQVEGKAASEITHFIATISEGDIVWAADGATILGIGRVTGEYRFEPDFDFPHQRPVEWLNCDEWKMPFHEGLQTTVREIKKHNENILETERRMQGEGPPSIKPPTPVPKIKRPIRLDDIPGRIQSILDRKAQVILYGPPGTGKTYWAERAANDLAAISAFGQPFAMLSEDQKRTVVGDDQSLGLVRLCCFHPAYGYE
jgi:5-methylcytosine-specific restriction protein B